MDFSQIIDVFLHLDVHLNQWAEYFGVWLYVVLFAIVFCETGLVVTPFLPGDSLLFAVGALAASPNSPFSLTLLFVLLTVAAILGDAVNYAIGAWLGPKVFRSENSWLLNKNHLLKTQHFYEKYGGKTIVLARFIPIIRTFAPFVAGIGKMRYTYFAFYNIFGALAWVSIFLFGGYWLAEQPWVKKNFTYVIIAIIIISVMPPVLEFVMSRRRGADGKNPTLPLEEDEPETAHAGK
ncbi:MAG: DedA family protein [Planctomycetia bacterium]|nr:DedA family protein [Planctomycetia bacterium]